MGHTNPGQHLTSSPLPLTLLTTDGQLVSAAAPPCSPKVLSCSLSLPLRAGARRSVGRARQGPGPASAAAPRPQRPCPGPVPTLSRSAGPPRLRERPSGRWRAPFGGAPSALLGCGLWHTEPGGACLSATCVVSAGAFLPLVPRLTVAVATRTAWGSTAGIAGCTFPETRAEKPDIAGLPKAFSWCSDGPARAPRTVPLQAPVTRPCPLHASSITVLPREADVFLLPFQPQMLRVLLFLTLPHYSLSYYQHLYYSHVVTTFHLHLYCSRPFQLRNEP